MPDFRYNDTLKYYLIFPLQRSNDHLSYKTTFSKQKGQPYMEATVSNPEETTTDRIH
jgi:hypothetical protein